MIFAPMLKKAITQAFNTRDEAIEAIHINTGTNKSVIVRLLHADTSCSIFDLMAVANYLNVDLHAVNKMTIKIKRGK